MFAIAVDQRTRSVAAGVIPAAEATGIRRHRTRSKQSQLHVVARGQRQVIVGSSVDNRIDLRRFCFQYRCGATDFDGLADLPDLHFHVDTRNLVQHQGKCRICASLETLFFNTELVVADGKLRDAVETRLVGYGRIGDSAFHRLGGDIGPGHSRTALISDCASY